MIGEHKAEEAIAYREESVKSAIYTMLIVVAVVIAPLGWLNQKVGAEGFKGADTTPFENLVLEVGQDLEMVKDMLVHERVDENLVKSVVLTPVITLITPDIMPTNLEESVGQDSPQFTVVLSGIYWSSHDPIVTINGKNYHVGEQIQGHRIVEISKTEVVFEDPLGEKIIKYFYDYLGES